MATFSISAMAAQCGVTTANIRSWERYGLLQPTKDEAGNRFYCIEDAIRIQHIIDALSKGFSLKEIKPALYGEETHCRSGWLFYQEEILAQCRKFEPAKLRKLLWRYGREIPPCIVIESILRPLRLWLSAGDDDARRFEKALLDTAIIEYATFQLSSVRKAPAGTMLIAAFSLNDPIELWLETIKYCSEGMRVEVIPWQVPMPDLLSTSFEHIVLWHDETLTPAQENLIQALKESGKFSLHVKNGSGLTLLPAVYRQHEMPESMQHVAPQIHANGYEKSGTAH
ncbi:MerR family transcriptional regulator [Salmonella enterica subsp. enterica serovar Abony]|nr:MerR family transcriptional regulator [Salmonella enterica subsp. enterica serovar Abony]EDH1237316.1 MerR family transcriptional regulator [Salmonella enterica subsp. enterica]MKM03301.1 MerR family transcriptional regulator [Salmonella enterica subsp. enterica serovar Isaszeg]HBD1791338.1 MerR family transcriptional regulator [Salmonella enterica]EBY6400726.1 MerR family transcriptional regulator [Salmonella enterica subsp. enterica serovar Abony]